MRAGNHSAGPLDALYFGHINVHDHDIGADTLAGLQHGSLVFSLGHHLHSGLPVD
jgi:hypothetical protein